MVLFSLLDCLGLGVKGCKFICYCHHFQGLWQHLCFLSQQNLGSVRLGSLSQAAGTSVVGLILLAGDTVRVSLDLKAVTTKCHFKSSRQWASKQGKDLPSWLSNLL